MNLDELIVELGLHDKQKQVRFGFGSPNSYRGDYAQIGFEPATNTTVGEMLQHAESCLGATFTGYKGGEFKMDEYTEVYLAPYGDTGEEIGERFLRMMLDDCGLDNFDWDNP